MTRAALTFLAAAAVIVAGRAWNLSRKRREWEWDEHCRAVLHTGADELARRERQKRTARRFYALLADAADRPADWALWEQQWDEQPRAIREPE